MKWEYVNTWRDKKFSKWTSLMLLLGRYDSPITALLYQNLPLYLRFFVYRELKPLKNRQFRLDLAFPIARYAVEIDGAAYHLDKMYDLDRDALIEAKGWEIDRFTGSEIYRQPRKVVGDIQQKFWFRLTSRISPLW